MPPVTRWGRTLLALSLVLAAALGAAATSRVMKLRIRIHDLEMLPIRSDASALTEAGFVRLNGKRVTAPSHPVRAGDVVTLALDRAIKVIRVEGFCERRGPAPAARALYRDLTMGSTDTACH